MTDFADFLIARGAASQADVLAAIDVQRRSRAPIGRLALQARILDIGQVFAILAHQARHAPIRFGEAAVALGVLHREQVDELLRMQRTQTTPLEDFLVKTGALDEATAREMRRVYELEHRAAQGAPAVRVAVPRSRRSA